MSKKRKNKKVTVKSYGNEFDPVMSKASREPTEEEIDAEIKKSKLSFYDAREKLRNNNGS